MDGSADGDAGRAVLVFSGRGADASNETHRSASGRRRPRCRIRRFAKNTNPR